MNLCRDNVTTLFQRAKGKSPIQLWLSLSLNWHFLSDLTFKLSYLSSWAEADFLLGTPFTWTQSPVAAAHSALSPVPVADYGVA